MGVHVIEQPTSPTERWLVETVSRQASQAGIGMPEVGIFDSPQPNAFATGMSRNNALVAVSSGLLQQMNQGEVEAVLAHEVSHVGNGDMVTMGLIQGVVNTFVVFFSRVIGHFVDRVIFKTERGYGPGYYGVRTSTGEYIPYVRATPGPVYYYTGASLGYYPLIYSTGARRVTTTPASYVQYKDKHWTVRLGGGGTTVTYTKKK